MIAFAKILIWNRQSINSMWRPLSFTALELQSLEFRSTIRTFIKFLDFISFTAEKYIVSIFETLKF